MGEKQVMDLEKTRARLEKRLRDLTDRADHIDEDLRQPVDDDWSEQAVESANDEVLEEVSDLARDEIRDIRRAPGQIDAGTYGICVRCGDSIPAGRMAALPHATECVKCA